MSSASDTALGEAWSGNFGDHAFGNRGCGYASASGASVSGVEIDFTPALVRYGLVLNITDTVKTFPADIEVEISFNGEIKQMSYAEFLGRMGFEGYDGYLRSLQ